MAPITYIVGLPLKSIIWYACQFDKVQPVGSCAFDIWRQKVSPPPHANSEKVPILCTQGYSMLIQKKSLKTEREIIMWTEYCSIFQNVDI